MRIQDFLLRLDKVKKKGRGWMARCPAHDDRDPSLYVSGENGRIRVKCYAGCSTEEVLRALGLERSDLFIDLPPCNILPDGIPAKWYGKTFVALWPYRDVQGNILGYAVRYEDGSGKKDVVPFFKKKNGNKWQAGGPKEPRPLYNLDRLSGDDSKPVIFCEGEKAADAAQRLLKNRGFVATTTQGGGKAADKTDFSPLRGRLVWIWPDADEPGMKYATTIANLARKAGAKSIHIIDVKALGFEIGSKKDAADWPRERQIPDPLPILSEDRAPRLLLTPLSEIEPEKVTWLWEPYLAQGKLTLLEGDPGVGKTWVALAICTHLTASGHRVIYASCEDGTADTLRPRVDGMSGNLSKFFILQGLQMDNVVEPFNLGQLAYLREVFEEYRPSLLVLDPIQGFLGSDVDMHRANEVRSRLAGIMALAEEFSCAVILVRHLNKSNTYQAIYKGLGSIDFSAAARSILLVGVKDKQRALVHVKNSLGHLGPSLGFEIREGQFSWLGEVDVSASDVLETQDKPEKRSALKEAMEFLKEILADGPVHKKEIDKQARNFGISDRTLRRAREKLKIKVLKERNQKGKVVAWLWSLPDDQNEYLAENPLKTKNGHLDESSQNRMNTIIKPDDQKRKGGHLDGNIEKSNTYDPPTQVAKYGSYRETFPGSNVGHLDSEAPGKHCHGVTDEKPRGLEDKTFMNFFLARAKPEIPTEPYWIKKAREDESELEPKIFEDENTQIFTGDL